MPLKDGSSPIGRRKAAVTLAVGYLALAVAIWIARGSPAAGHEVSPYPATPMGFWVGVALALLVALLVPLSVGSFRHQAVAIGLGGLSTGAIAALPLIRGYHFYGLYDALTHLGWTNDIATGALEPTGLLYPGIHLLSLFIATVTGLATPTAILLMVVVLVCVFLVFVPLSVRTIVPERDALFVGAFSAFLFLPITHLSTHMNAHTMSQSILFSTLLVFLVVKFLASPSSDPSAPALSMLLAVVIGVTVVFHPQLAAHVLVVFVGVCVIQMLYRLVTTDHPAHDRPTLYGHTVFLGGMFVLWSSNHGLFIGIGARAVGSVVDFVLERGSSPAGESIGAQSSSLLAIGGSLEVVFLKLFLVSLVFCIATAAVVLAALTSWRERAPETTWLVLALGAGLAALGPVFVFYYVGTLSEMYFRAFGLMMLFATILGAVAFTLGANALAERFPMRAVGLLLAGVFVCLLILSLLTVFPSPYVYNQSPHVTEQQMHGHAVAFDNQHGDVPYMGVRSGPYRYVDAIYGGGRTSEFDEAVPREAMHDGLSAHVEGDRYVVVTEIDERREVDAYHELRYAEEDFDAIGAQPGVHRVHSNGEFELYAVRAERTDSERS